MSRDRKKVVYVAGKFRGSTHPEWGYNAWEQEENIRVAERLAHDVWTKTDGLAVPICPHSMTRHYQGSGPDDLWLDGDIELLLRCDAILMVDNWEDSVGAIEEKKTAEYHGIPVFYDIGELQVWLGT